MELHSQGQAKRGRIIKSSMRDVNFEYEAFDSREKPLIVLTSLPEVGRSLLHGALSPESAGASCLPLCLLFWEVARP